MAIAKLETKEWTKFFKETKGKLSRRANLLRKAYAIVGFKDIIDHFRQERGPKGKWKQRDRKTNRRYDQIRRSKSKRVRKDRTPRRSFNSSNKLLQLTGNMRQNILPRNSTIKGREAILVFNPVKYSGAHDRGTRDIPQREFMWLSDKGKKLMLKIVMSDIIK